MQALFSILLGSYLLLSPILHSHLASLSFSILAFPYFRGYLYSRNTEGEGFFGIPLSRASASKLQTTTTFQEQFDFEVLTDRNFSYVAKFGTNHGWLLGEKVDNGPASIVDKDTAHIPLFYYGTTNPDVVSSNIFGNDHPFV